MLKFRLFYNRSNALLKPSKNCSLTSTFLKFFGTKQFSVKSNTVKYSLVGTSVCAFVGMGYAYNNSKKPSVYISNEESLPFLSNHSAIKPSRKVKFLNDTSGLKLTLYQYQTCPFCCKVRAYLDYHGISYNIIEVNPVLRQSIKWSQYKKVPILLAEVSDGYQQLNDSTLIISALSSYLINVNEDLKKIVKSYPFIYYNENDTVKFDILNKYFLMDYRNVNKMESSERIMEEHNWRKWADNVLVHTLSPNVYRTYEEALQAFKWFSEVGQWDVLFSTWERVLVVYVGAFSMWMISKRLKKKYNLKDDVRESLYDECNLWMNEIKKKGTPFMGGSKPDLSDLAVYGILTSIEGCYAFDDLLKHSIISTWYKAMKNAVKNHEGMR